MEFLVRRVNPIVRQAEAYQRRRQSHDVVKGRHGGIGATGSHKNRCGAKDFVAGSGGRFNQRMSTVDKHWLGRKL